MPLIVITYGLIMSFFLKKYIYQFQKAESKVFFSSNCPQCFTRKKWYNNIPFFSYLLLIGKCRHCGVEISKQYPIVESLNLIIYLVLFNHFNFTVDFIFYIHISSVLIIITFIDLSEMIIPDIFVVILLLLSLLHKGTNYLINGRTPEIINNLGGLVLAGGIFILIAILSKGGMGGGDVTLIAALGFMLGVNNIMFNILLSFLLGAIISLILLATKIKTVKDPIPFGPFIVLAFFVTLLWGDFLIDWYLNLFIMSGL